MAKPMQNIEHSPNCSCCGKQPSFQELGRRPSGFGDLKSAPLPKKTTPHSPTKSHERVGTVVDRRKSLQHGIEATRETSPQDTYDKLTSGDRSAADISAEIVDDVADRNQLQAKESRLKGTSKDKESLLEECCALKNALANQLYHLQLHKVHHESVHLEQRRMEIAIEELEVGNGLEAPRTGGFSRLNAKLLGLKCRQQEYFATLTTLHNDLETLKKDPRVSFTNEADVERDVFATETRRLQKMVRRLRTSYHKVCAQNNECIRLRENIVKLATKIQEIQTNIKDKKNLVEQMKKDIDKTKADAIEAQYNTRNAMKKAAELVSHSSVLQDMLVREKQEGSQIRKQTSNLSEQTRMVRQANADADMAAKMLQASEAAAAAAAVAEAGKGKGGIGKKGQNIKLKQSPPNTNLDSDASKDTNASKSKGADSDASRKSKEGQINKDLLEARKRFLKEIADATNQFIENAPRSRPGSPRAKAHEGLGSLDGDHSEYNMVRNAFQNEAEEAENRFLAEMEKIEFGSPRPKMNPVEEAKRLALELEAMKKAASAKAWLQNLTIQLDGETLNPSEYLIDVQDSSTSVKITSPGESPQALAKKKAEEARKKKQSEDAAKQATQDEERKKKEDEEAAIRAKKAVEDAAKLSQEAELKKKKDAEEATKKAIEAKKATEASKAASAALASTSTKKEFFDDKMQGVIKKNIQEVLGHLENISETVQQKATSSGTAEETAKDILDKIDKPK